MRLGAKSTDENVEADFSVQRTEAMRLLQTEAELQEIVQLVGMDALSAPDRLKLEAARSIREDFLHQNSFHDVDTYTSLQKQHDMMKIILTWYNKALAALEQHVHLDKLIDMPVREQIGRVKYIAEKDWKEQFAAVAKELDAAFAALTEGGEN